MTNIHEIENFESNVAEFHKLIKKTLTEGSIEDIKIFLDKFFLLIHHFIKINLSRTRQRNKNRR